MFDMVPPYEFAAEYSDGEVHYKESIDVEALSEEEREHLAERTRDSMGVLMDDSLEIEVRVEGDDMIAEVRGETSKGQAAMMLAAESLFVAQSEGGDIDRIYHAIKAMRSVEVTGDEDLDPGDLPDAQGSETL